MIINADPGISSLRATHELRVLKAVCDEVRRARRAHSDFHSAHEGYAVILEELDELWSEIKHKTEHRDMGAMREEAVQVAAMAVRFITDLCPEESRE